MRGGLGNQLFQYAHAFWLANELSAELVVDDGWYRGRRPRRETSRRFLLDSYVLPFRYPTACERLGLALVSLVVPVQKRFGVRLFPFHLEGLPLQWQRLWRSRTVVVQGYWQGFHQVQRVLPQLRTMLRPSVSLSSKAYSRILDEVSSCPEPVVVHVRRGDYMANPISAAYHGVCSLEYYSRAFAHLQSHCRHPHLFLFSDDLTWACENLPFGDMPFTPVDLGDQPDADLAELDLMSRCHHAIIANSTFSWWGAVLIDHPGRIVITPFQWFASGPAPELYVPGWVVL